MVKSAGNWKSNGNLASTYNVTCDELHRHFVNIATDKDYVRSLITDQRVNNTAVNNSVAFCEWSDEYIAKLLSKIKNLFVFVFVFVFVTLLVDMMEFL